MKIFTAKINEGVTSFVMIRSKKTLVIKGGGNSGGPIGTSQDTDGISGGIHLGGW